MFLYRNDFNVYFYFKTKKVLMLAQKIVQMRANSSLKLLMKLTRFVNDKKPMV